MEPCYGYRLPSSTSRSAFFFKKSNIDRHIVIFFLLVLNMSFRFVSFRSASFPPSSRTLGHGGLSGSGYLRISFVPPTPGSGMPFIAFATRGSSWSRQAQVRVDKTIQLERAVHVVQNRGCLGGSRIPTCSHALRSLCSSRIYTCGVVLSVVTMALSTMHLGPMPVIMWCR